MLRNIKADFWNMCDLSPRVESVRTQTLSELGGFPEISLGENLSKFSHSIISFRTEVSPSYSGSWEEIVVVVFSWSEKIFDGVKNRHKDDVCRAMRRKASKGWGILRSRDGIFSRSRSAIENSPSKSKLIIHPRINLYSPYLGLYRMEISNISVYYIPYIL